MANFIIEEKQGLKVVSVNLENESVRAESGALHYYQGAIEMDAKVPGVGGFFKAAATGENIIRPVYSGTGKVYFEPTYGEFHKLNFQNESWIFDRGAYVCSEMSIEIGVHTNKLTAGLIAGEGMWQTKISGSGNVIIKAHGPIETIELQNDKICVDGYFVVGRTEGIDFSISKAAKGLFGSMTSGEGLLNTFVGTGKLLVCPVPSFNAKLFSSLDLISYTSRISS